MTPIEKLKAAERNLEIAEIALRRAIDAYEAAIDARVDAIVAIEVDSIARGAGDDT